MGGGRFMTNPGQVWTQDAAQYYGDTLSAAFTIGVTHQLSMQGGLGYPSVRGHRSLRYWTKARHFMRRGHAGDGR